MTEIHIPLGKFNIAYKTFRGFAAPDEDVERPVNNDNVEKKLYSRKKAVWQPVQVEIPEGLRFIGYRSFEDCRGLTAVSIPNSITGIGNRAFCSCISLTHVTLPDSVTEIGEEAFLSCTALTRACVPESVKTIGESAFARCTALQEITVPDALCSQAKRIFGDLEWVSWRWFAGKLQVNPALANVFRTDLKKRRKDIAAGVIASEDGETLDRYLALWDKVPLDFLDGLIETSVHTQKTGITALLMQYKNSKYTQTHIEMAQQRRAEKELGLRNRSVADWRQIFVLHEEAGQFTITGYKQCDAVVEVPAMIGNKPVVAIARWVPRGKQDQREPYTVFLPEGIQEIGKYAFYKCNLKAINIPSTVKKIGISAFKHCERIESISIPSGVTRIEKDTFEGCTALKSVSLPDSVTYLDLYAFYNCTALGRLVLPAAVQEITGDLRDWRSYWSCKTQVVAPRGSVTAEALRKNGTLFEYAT